MKITHKADIDYVSIDFRDEVEAKSVYENGIIIRLDKKGGVIGIDITDSSRFFSGESTLSLQEAARLLGVSESTMRRRIRDRKIPFSKPNGKDYVLRREDILKLVS